MSTTTRIAVSTPDDIIVRGKSLCHELMGTLSFTEMMCFQILGRVPDAAQRALVDACLLALMEHGLTPSVLTARLVYSSAPEALQAAVGAGLLGVGSRFVGTVEGCAALLDADDRGRRHRRLPPRPTRIVDEHRAARQPLPGFGHNLHVPDDPRTPAPVRAGPPARRGRGPRRRHRGAVGGAGPGAGPAPDHQRHRRGGRGAGRRGRARGDHARLRAGRPLRRPGRPRARGAAAPRHDRRSGRPPSAPSPTTEFAGQSDPKGR